MIAKFWYASFRHHDRFHLVGLTAFLLHSLPAYVLASNVYVGNPASPGALASALQSAYVGGATDIVINTGTYTFAPGSSVLTLSNWKNVTVDFTGCVFIDTDPTGSDNLWLLNGCTNVTLQGGTITCSNMPMSENPITSLGSVDAKGYQTYNVATSSGYPSLTLGTANQFVNVVNGQTLLYKQGTGDFYSATVTSLGSGAYNVDFNQACPTLSIGDYIVSRSATMCGYKVRLTGCTSCTVQNITLYRNGFANIREDGCSGDIFNNVTWAAGPAPSGSSHAPLFSCGADGTDALGDTKGPTYKNCQMSGLLNDDNIAIHGYTWPITSVSSSTITISDSSFGGRKHPAVGEPLQLFDAKFYQQGTITAVSDGGTTSTITLSGVSNIPSDCFTSDPNDCGPGYQILNCVLSPTRSRGIIAKASDGLIEGNTIQNAGIASILVGYEGYPYSTEGGYVSNVIITDNSIQGCAQMQPGICYGAIYVAPPGPQGNQNIYIENNVFNYVAGLSLYINSANNVQVAYNIFANTADFVNNYHVLQVTNTNALTLTNNLLTSPGANTASPWYQEDSLSTNLSGLNSSGLGSGLVSSGVYLMQHQGTTEYIDDVGSGSQTGLEQESYTGGDKQLWVPILVSNGNYTLGSFGTGSIMNIPGGDINPGTQIDLYPYNVSNNDLWTITNQGNGTYKAINVTSGLALDAYGNNNNNGAIIDEATPNGSSGQSWGMTFVESTGGPNLISNFSFEANGGYTKTPNNWTINGTSDAGYVQGAQGEGAEDGNYYLVLYNTSPWNCTVSQTVTGLADGIYSATAYVEDSAHLSQAYMFASNYGGSELTVNAPAGTSGGIAGWQKITIPVISVTNGECTIGFYGQDATGGNPIYVDNVQVFKQF